MKTFFQLFTCLVLLSVGVVCFSSFSGPANGGSSADGREHLAFPWKQAGLTDRQAAAHLLDRFTYGATPGEIDEVLSMGIENWFLGQLDGKLPDDSLNSMLSGYDALTMSNTQILNTFPKPGEVVRMAVKEGIISKDSVNKSDKKEYRDQIASIMQHNGQKPEQELFRQFINQKILRAAYTHNQMREVLTDFWFNHFNVSITKNDCAQFIPDYERDVIRPRVTGKFGDMLLATAQSPAMLYYLDNFSSAAANTAANNRRLLGNVGALPPQIAAKMDPLSEKDEQFLARAQQAKKNQGLNENYAREVMELHTLGVDGGYTQQDVTQAAKVLTGWTVFPMGENAAGAAIKKMIERVGEHQLEQRGFVHQGDFLFAVNRHDNDPKTVLGRNFPRDGGYEEGVTLLSMLAHHPSTAHFISKKLAVRFVNDDPSPALVERMAQTFLAKDGDIRQVLITMVSSPEFWNKDAVREKTKSPFELAISSVRALHASIKAPYQLYTWITKMGQKMYFYQAPTGFPDKGQYWINTGALLNRMNFGLALASQRIPGITIDLVALNQHHEPESTEAALTVYSRLMMPERDIQATVQRLTPMLNDPNLVKKVDEAAGKTAAANENMGETAMNTDEMTEQVKFKNDMKGFKKNNINTVQLETGSNTMLSQVVGIIIGSPEFQRR